MAVLIDETIQCAEYFQVPIEMPDAIIPNRHLLVQGTNGNTITLYEICSKLTVKIPERRH